MCEPAQDRAPEGNFRLTRLERIEARLVAHDWAWARANADWIAGNWERRRARAPGMFDGPVLLSCACAIADGVCRIDLFETTYARFIAYRDAGRPDGRVANAFAAIAPWSADGAVLVGEMGAHTANAGELYFPCGTPDRGDVRGRGAPGDAVDLAGSAAREFTEETGLSLPAGAEAGWILLAGEGQLAFLRPVRFPESADALRDRIECHRLREAEPELAGIRILRGAADIAPARSDDRLAGFVRAYLADAFATGRA